MLNSALGAYYYLRIIVMMYMREPRGEVPVAPLSLAASLAIAVSVVATLVLGVLPGRVLDYATESAHQLTQDVTAPASASVSPPTAP